MKTPKKLKIAAIIMAGLGAIALVDTQVAIAFGASVHPLTNMTAMVSSADTKSAGLSATADKKFRNDNDMNAPPLSI